MEDLFTAIASLVSHGIRSGLLEETDRIYTTNMILERLRLDHWDEPVRDNMELEEALKVILDYAVAQELTGGDSVVYRDLFDTAVMNCLLPRPSEVIRRFNSLYAVSPEAATDWYYGFSRASDYIRTYRVARDIKWDSATPYGHMIITINLSKPEKDPKAIAAALSMKQSSYPKCQLCRENEGYAGRVNHPARENHRIIPITVNGSPWFLQYSPYVYYNEHCIVFNSEHTPMKIDHAAFDKLLDFIRQFPHYCVGSNADLPIVGGSILTHDHFQGGRFDFPMAQAGISYPVSIRGFEDISAGVVHWPMTVIRISGRDPKRLSDCADAVLKSWRSYTDESAQVLAYTVGNTAELQPGDIHPMPAGTEGAVPHNTITPIARIRGGEPHGSIEERLASGAVYEMDLVLRNNLTTAEHPLGIYHPHAEHHHIKKENIGLIEVMGLAILPARLKTELAELAEVILTHRDIRGDEVLAKHADWVDMIYKKYPAEALADIEQISGALRAEVGLVYSGILEQCAVFKPDKAGRQALERFICSI